MCRCYRLTPWCNFLHRKFLLQADSTQVYTSRRNLLNFIKKPFELRKETYQPNSIKQTSSTGPALDPIPSASSPPTDKSTTKTFCNYIQTETRTSPALRPRAFSKSEMPTSPDSNESSLRSASSSRFLVHGRDRIKNVHFYSLLGLSSHKNVKCYPTMTKYI